MIKVVVASLVSVLAVASASFATQGIPREKPEAPQAQGDQAREDQAQEDTERALDPVCKIAVRRNPELSVDHRGETYYFCMKADMEAFKKDPDKYLQDSDHTHPDPRR